MCLSVPLSLVRKVQNVDRNPFSRRSKILNGTPSPSDQRHWTEPFLFVLCLLVFQSLTDKDYDEDSGRIEKITFHE